MSALELVMMKRVGELNAEVKRLKAENERLRKAGNEMGKHLPDTDEANRAYMAFQEGITK